MKSRRAVSRGSQFLLCLLCLTCNRDSGVKADKQTDDAAVLSHESLNPTKITGTLFSYNPMFGRLYGMIATPTEVWLADIVGDPFLHLVSTQDGSLLRSVGRRGEGPGEFAGADDLSIRPDDESGGLWVFDIGRKRETWMGRGAKAAARTLKSSLPVQSIHAVWLTRDRLLAVGRVDTARFFFLDSTGTTVSIAPGVLLGPDSVPANVRMKPSMAIKICVRPGGSSFALTYLSAGRIEFYDDQAHLLRLGAVPFGSNGVFRAPSGRGGWTWQAPRTWYISCSGSTTRLYALFSGRLLAKFPRDVSGNGVYVHVFDWEGHLIRVLQLDHEATSIAVLGDSLLFSSAASSDSVYQYAIPRPHGE